MSQLKNLWELLAPSLLQYANNPAWICRQLKRTQVVSYQQLYDATLSTADRLRESGIKSGDTVGIIAPNGAEFTVAALAAWKIRANIAPIHIGNSEYDIKKQLEAIAPQIMLVYMESKTPSHLAKQQTNNDGEGVLSMDISLLGEAERIDREAAIFDEEQGQARQLAVRIYTSGSTGKPKVVQLSHANLASNLLAACKIAKFDTKDRFISLLPFSHLMGLLGNLLLPLYNGAAIISPKALVANEIINTIQQENISVVIAVPKLFRNLMLGLEKKFQRGGVIMAWFRVLLKISPLWLRQYLNAPIRKKLGGKIKIWVSGGSHLDSRISHYYHELGLPLRQGYGLTETSPLTSIQESFDSAPESVGKPIEQVQVKIHQPDNKGFGEIWIKGANVMLGYEDPQQNAEALQDGWFKSGDLGYLDEEGRIFLSGRSKCLIVTESGKNVYPEELKVLLERNSAIKEAGVFELNMKPVCVLAMQENAGNAEARTALARFNRLTSVHNRITRFALVDDLPHTALGKIALPQLPKIFARNEIKDILGSTISNTTLILLK